MVWVCMCFLNPSVLRQVRKRKDHSICVSICVWRIHSGYPKGARQSDHKTTPVYTRWWGKTCGTEVCHCENTTVWLGWKKKRAPSPQLHADRRVGAAHLVWQRSSKSKGLNESDRLKEQLNYEAWMPRRGKRKHVDLFLCLHCLDDSSLYKSKQLLVTHVRRPKMNCWQLMHSKLNSNSLLKTMAKKNLIKK